ncbi:transposable element Tcb2 transposase [Trichonephila clavipes]|nr:transposable element Tcb2 transposase [Trichonephila clavipes]
MSFKRRQVLSTSALPQTIRRENHHIVRNACLWPTASSATIQAQVAPPLGAPVSLEPYKGARLISEDNRFLECRPRGERLTPTFALQQHNAPTAGVMVWSVIGYNTLSPLVLICSTLTD